MIHQDLITKDNTDSPKENGQIVITREISDGTIHKGGGDKDYELVGGYSSGKQKDVIRVNMAKMGVIIQNPKDLFTEWSNEDYNAIADNLNTKANELYASAEKDSKAITSGITDSVKRGEHFMAIAMGAAQKAVAQDQMMQSIAQAYLTGGMAGIQQMVKDKIRDAFIDKVAEATGINPDLVRFASGRFEQAKLNNQAAKIGTGVGVMASLALGPVGPLMMAGPMGGALLGAGAGGKLGSSLSGGTMRTILNNPVTDAALTMSAGVSGAMMGGPAGLVAGVAAKNKFMKSNSIVSNNNQYNSLKQQENALIQDAAGQAVANAIGRPDAAGNFSQILGGLKKRQVAKRDNANLGKVASSGVASALNMANGMVKGIVRNAVIAVGGKTDTFDQLTANPFTPPATWTGAAKVDMSKEGLMNRAQEMAYAKFLENNGMDAGLANIVASGMNGKIKAAKAKKEEKTKAIESTAQTALAITAIALTGGGAGPALGSVLTGGASGTFYAVQGANIALQAAIGSRTGGPQGALAGVVNGTLQALAATNFGKLAEGADKLLDKADEIQTMAINNPLIAKTMAATNVSYSKENGWGIKANLSGVVNALGVRGGVNFERFTNVTIGQSQRGGASVNLGFNTGKGTLGLNYTGATGKFDGSFDVMERQAGTGKLSAELNYGEDGFSVSGNADLGNGLGFGLESGRNGTTGSLTILGSQQGTVDEDGNYEANGNFLGEISGQDIIDLNKTRQDQRDAEENERNPVKDAKNAKNAADAKEARDDDAKEVGGEEGPSGLVDLAFAGLGVVMSAGAAFLAGGGSGSPTAPASGQSGAGNGGNANTSQATFAGRKEDEKDGKVKRDGDTKDEPPKKQPTKEELANFKDNVFLNTTRAATDDYLAKLDAQGVDTKEMRAHAEAQRNAGVRDLTAGEIQAKRDKAEAARVNNVADNTKNTNNPYLNPLSNSNLYDNQSMSTDEVPAHIKEGVKQYNALMDAYSKNGDKGVQDFLYSGNFTPAQRDALRKAAGSSSFKENVRAHVGDTGQDGKGLRYTFDTLRVAGGAAQVALGTKLLGVAGGMAATGVGIVPAIATGTAGVIAIGYGSSDAIIGAVDVYRARQNKRQLDGPIAETYRAVAGKEPSLLTHGADMFTSFVGSGLIKGAGKVMIKAGKATLNAGRVGIETGEAVVRTRSLQPAKELANEVITNGKAKVKEAYNAVKDKPVVAAVVNAVKRGVAEARNIKETVSASIAMRSLSPVVEQATRTGFNTGKFISDMDTVGNKYGVNWFKKQIEFYESGRLKNIEFQGIRDGDYHTVDLKRYFNKDGPLEVNHFLFDVPSNMQGKGLSKEVFRTLYEHYQDAGVKAINLTANIEVGGYAWANYGFVATREYEVRRILETVKIKLKDQNSFRIYDMATDKWKTMNRTDLNELEGVINNYYTKNPKSESFPMNKISQLSYGKNVLLNTSWNGRLDLTDPKRIAILEDYLRRK